MIPLTALIPALAAILCALLLPATAGAGHGGAHVHDRYFGLTDNASDGIAWDPADAQRRDPMCEEEGWTLQGCMEAMFRVNRAHGVSWATLTGRWHQIVGDHSGNEPNWGPLDEKVRAAACQGVQPVVRVIGAPHDVRVGGAGGDGTAPPTAGADGLIPELQVFVRDLVARYGPGGSMPAGSCLDGSQPPQALRRVPAIVVWNEQNTPGHWGGHDPYGVIPGCHRGTPPPSASGVPACDSRLHYLRVLRSARSGRDAGNRSVQVVTGGITARAVGERRFRYYDTLYGRGIPPNPQFDALGVHPYAPHGGSDGSGLSAGDVVAALRREMTDRDAGEKRMWIIEAGWPSCRTQHDDYPRRYNPGACPREADAFGGRNSTEADQRTKLASTIEWVTENRSTLNLDRFGLWSFVDLGQCGSAYLDGSGREEAFPPRSPPVLSGEVRMSPPSEGGRGCASEPGVTFDVGTSIEAGFVNQATAAVCRWCEGSGLFRKDWSAKPALSGWHEEVGFWRGRLNP